jgi:hypothetical protein
MRYLYLFIFLGMSYASLAQPAREVKYLSTYAHPQISRFTATFGVGFNAFDGTVSGISNLSEQNHFLSPVVSLGAGYRLTHYIEALFRTSYIRQKSETASGDIPIPGFRSHSLEGILALKHSFFPQRDFDEYLRRWNYYGLIGAGAVYFDPRHLGTSEALITDPDVSKLALVVPVGVGVDFRLSNFFSMGAEIAYRFSTTNYMDGVATTDYSALNKYDNYATLGFFVNYRIPRSQFHYQEFLRLKDSTK